MAADFTQQGRDVILCELPEYAASVAGRTESGRLDLTEHGQTSTVELRITTDVGHALAAARSVHVVIPANGQDAFFRAMLPHLDSHHRVVVWSGRLGAMRLARLAHVAGAPPFQLAEVNTLAYGARLDGPGRPHVLYRATAMHAAGFPASQTTEVLDELRALYPEIPIHDSGTVLGAALLNSSLLVLPTGTVLNAGCIDRGDEEYFLERDGLTPHVTRVIGAINREFALIGEQFGVTVPIYSQAVLDGPGSIEAVNFRGDTDLALMGLSGPGSVDHRYLRENIPYGFVPLIELARAAGVGAPVTESIVTLSRAMLDCLDDQERTLGTLGLEGLSVPEICDVFTTGSYLRRSE